MKKASIKFNCNNKCIKAFGRPSLGGLGDYHEKVIMILVFALWLVFLEFDFSPFFCLN